MRVKVGHDADDYDGASGWTASGRADIVIFHEDRCLAVVELKRETLSLTADDVAQAQGYANQFTPRPPLIILSNGTGTYVYDSNTGAPWSPEDGAAKAVHRLLKNTAAVAKADMKWAVEVLMGPGAVIWPRVVRERTAYRIAQMTAPAGRGGKPFAEGLSLPRTATQHVLKALRAGETFVLLDGPPIVGKSSILRELAALTEDGSEYAVLMLRGGSTGLYQTIANLFSDALEWDVTPNSIRQWLRRLSRFGSGPALVLAIDGLEPGGAMALDLEELADTRFGPGIRVVATADDAARFTDTRNDRNDTAIGDRAFKIHVRPLTAAEFEAATAVLADLNIAFVRGASLADDYRAPWVLRSAYDALARLNHAHKAQGGLNMPPSLGLMLIDEARLAFGRLTTVLRGYTLLARDAIADETPTSTGLALAQSYTFLVRADALGSPTTAVTEHLIETGWLTRHRTAEGDDVFAPTTPELFASELALALSREVALRADTDPVAAAHWMANRLEGAAYGDLVGAQALRELINGGAPFAWPLVKTLLSMEPETDSLKEGLVAVMVRGDRIIHLRFEDGRARLTDRTGTEAGPEIQVEPDDLPRIYGRVAPWMALGLLAGLPIAMGEDDNRLDAYILLLVGQCPLPLMRASRDGQGHLAHDLGGLGQVLCHENGAIEGLTNSMTDLLVRPWSGADDWIDAAVETASLHLLHRVMIALLTIRDKAPARADWAHAALTERVRPAIDAILAHELPRQLRG